MFLTKAYRIKIHPSINQKIGPYKKNGTLRNPSQRRPHGRMSRDYPEWLSFGVACVYRDFLKKNCFPLYLIEKQSGVTIVNVRYSWWHILLFVVNVKYGPRRLTITGCQQSFSLSYDQMQQRSNFWLSPLTLEWFSSVTFATNRITFRTPEIQTQIRCDNKNVDYQKKRETDKVHKRKRWTHAYFPAVRFLLSLGTTSGMSVVCDVAHLKHTTYNKNCKHTPRCPPPPATLCVGSLV